VHLAANNGDLAQPTTLLTYANSVGQAAPCKTDPRAPLTLVKQLPRHACVSRLAGQPDEWDKGVDNMLLRHRKAHDAAQCGRRQGVMVFNTPPIAVHRIPHQIAPKTQSVQWKDSVCTLWIRVGSQFPCNSVGGLQIDLGNPLQKESLLLSAILWYLNTVRMIVQQEVNSQCHDVFLPDI
jgi:hypothetical protein